MIAAALCRIAARSDLVAVLRSDTGRGDKAAAPGRDGLGQCSASELRRRSWRSPTAPGGAHVLRAASTGGAARAAGVDGLWLWSAKFLRHLFVILCNVTVSFSISNSIAGEQTRSL